VAGFETTTAPVAAMLLEGIDVYKRQTNDLPSVFCWVSQMANSHISSSISLDEMWVFRGALMSFCLLYTSGLLRLCPE